MTIDLPNKLWLLGARYQNCPECGRYFLWQAAERKRKKFWRLWCPCCCDDYFISLDEVEH